MRKIKRGSGKRFREIQFDVNVLSWRRSLSAEAVPKPKIQADDITIVDIVPKTKTLMAKLDKLHQHSLIGSREKKFSQSYNEEDGTFFGTVLWQKERRTGRRNLFVSEMRAFSAVRVEVLLSLRNFMETRLDIDDRTKESFSSFVRFSANEEDIREVHASVAPDLDLRSLAQQYDRGCPTKQSEQK